MPRRPGDEPKCHSPFVALGGDVPRLQVCVAAHGGPDPPVWSRCWLFSASCTTRRLEERRGAWRWERRRVTRFEQFAQLADLREVRPEVMAFGVCVARGTLTRLDLAFDGVLPPPQGGAEARLPAVSVPVPVRLGVLAGPLRVGARHRAEALPGAGRRSHQGAPAPRHAGDREDGDAAPGGTPLGVRDLLRRGAGRPARPDRAGGGHRRGDRQPGGHQRRRVRRQPAPGPGVGGPGGGSPAGRGPKTAGLERGGERPSPGSPTCAGTRPTSAATSPTRCRAPSSTATT